MSDAADSALRGVPGFVKKQVEPLEARVAHLEGRLAEVEASQQAAARAALAAARRSPFAWVKKTLCWG